MEGVHGVDVSWLHHSPKDHYANKTTDTVDAIAEGKPHPNDVQKEFKSDAPTTPKANNAHPSQNHNHMHRPHLAHRQSAEKTDTPGSSSSKSPKDPKVALPGRRNSWMSSISSKFSSNSNPQPTTSETASTQSVKSPPPSPAPDSHTNPFGAAVTPTKKPDTPPSTPSSSPKTGHTFIQSALRRLSSSNGSTMGKASGTGGVCPRKTMNVDPYRERCSIPELDLQKLRRVAFCVDVEIAGAAQYVDEDPEAPPPPPLMGESSLTKSINEVESKKKKDQTLRKSEGAALKHPDVVAEEKDKDGVIRASGERVKPQQAPEPKSSEVAETNQPTKKREKKKRSEGERKERKERKHQEALANGTIPAEVKRETSSGSANDSSTGVDTPPNQDRPTTDPLRIYRRCCQLRETPVLKRITEQISSPSACPASTPSILSCLDLSGYWMQLPDLITLGDYLAVVPVKKLVLENCGLGDEAVRVVLAGLLAAKTPEQARHNKRLGKKGNRQDKSATERLGVVEKISLKNNPKIGKEGWRHISLFVNMSRSLKAIDLSLIPFPQPSATVDSVKHHTPNHSHPQSNPQIDMPTLLQEAIGERLGGSRLEELVMGQCGLNTDCIMKLVDGAMKCGITRLGLASNNMSREAFQHVLRYVRSGKCDGLDLGGNDLREDLGLLAEALDNTNPLYALSLADCHLSPSSLESLLPALVQLPNFRFIDLSHNRDLFMTRPTVLNNLRKYLPQCPIIKRIHLKDVAMSPEHAIALAEALSESRTLAHINILENHRLTPLASAKTEADQEEACALYASLMAAVRVSQTIVCIDIDVPSPDSSEVVKALAKQVVAYSLRNLERYPLQDSPDSAIAAMADPHKDDKQFTVPDILLHLVGHVDGFPENHDNDEPAPDDDYIVGGTGVVKALDICLNRAADARKSTRDVSPQRSGAVTPQNILQGAEVSKGKAKEMSKNLLDSARKIRARLLPALCKEAKDGDEMNYLRLKFLDSTLERIIERFENEYPETRLPKPTTTTNDLETSDISSTLENSSSYLNLQTIDTNSVPSADLDDNDSAVPLIRPESLSRRASSPSLASRQAQEEGRMHRFGQRIRRDILRPETEDYAHGTTGTEVEAEYLQDLRRRLEGLDGRELQEKVEQLNPDIMSEAFGATPGELAEWERRDPVGFQTVREASVAAGRQYQDQKSHTRLNFDGEVKS